MNYKKFVFLCFMIGFLSLTYAVDIPLTFVRSLIDNQQGLAIDSTTGKFYSHAYSSATSVRMYNSETDYINNIYTTINLASSPIHNNYFAVENGKIYGRTSYLTNAIGCWDATTGALLATGNADGLIGTNGQTGGFNWGGYSSINWFNDGGNIYVASKTVDSSSNYEWRINQIDSNLSQIDSKIFNASGTLGYGVIINGKFFASTSYSNNLISKVYDLSTNTLSSVSYTLTGAGTSFYWRDVTYNSLTDTVYFYNYHSSKFYKVENASVLFNAPSTAIPEPNSLFLLFFSIFLGKKLSKFYKKILK